MSLRESFNNSIFLHRRDPNQLISTQGIHNWIHPARPPGSHDALQDLRLYHHGSRPLLHPRSQTRPVHEDPMAIHVHGADHRHRLGLHRASRRPRMGPRRRDRGHLHRTPEQQVQLPQRARLLQRLGHLGPHRPAAHLLPGLPVRQPAVLLAGGRPGPGPLLRPRPRLPPRALPLPLRPAHLRRQQRHPPRHPAQLPHLGHRRLRLQQVHPEPLPRLVDALQLHHLRRPRRRPRHRHHRHHPRPQPHKHLHALLVGRQRREQQHG